MLIAKPENKTARHGIVAVLRRMGADIDWSSEDSIRFTARPCMQPRLTLSEIPDLVPVLQSQPLWPKALQLSAMGASD